MASGQLDAADMRTQATLLWIALYLAGVGCGSDGPPTLAAHSVGAAEACAGPAPEASASSPAATAQPDPSTANVTADGTRSSAPDERMSPCAVMRRAADTSQRMNGHEAHLAESRIEGAIRRHYRRNVWARGIDTRVFARHPVIFTPLRTASGDVVARCVADWREKDPTGIVPDNEPPFAADHHYKEVTFEFNDASDGENAYSAFVDVATMQVMAMFYYNNFRP